MTLVLLGVSFLYMVGNYGPEKGDNGDDGWRPAERAQSTKSLKPPERMRFPALLDEPLERDALKRAAEGREGKE